MPGTAFRREGQPVVMYVRIACRVGSCRVASLQRACPTGVGMVCCKTVEICSSVRAVWPSYSVAVGALLSVSASTMSLPGRYSRL